MSDLGGSEYLKVIHGLVQGEPPALSLKKEKKVHDLVARAIQKGLIRSAHDCSEGGLAVAVAECCISGPKLLGAAIVGAEKGRHGGLPLQEIAFLFAETQSRILVTVTEKDLQALLKLAKVKKCPARVLGSVRGTRLEINGLIDISVNELESEWRGGFERVLCAAS